MLIYIHYTGHFSSSHFHGAACGDQHLRDLVELTLPKQTDSPACVVTREDTMQWMRFVVCFPALFLHTCVCTGFPEPKSEPRCELGKFPCGSLPTCLPLQLQCDEREDCSNGADEANCGDNNGWADHLQSQVVNPALESAGIPRDCHLDKPVVPYVCQCIYTHIKCDKLDLVSVPANISQDVTRLNLQHNLIESLQNNSLGKLTALQSLNLRGNRIRTLPAGAFKGLTNLRQLYLSENLLESLPAGAFQGLQRLKWLYLQKNELRSLHADVFQGLNSLNWLDLRFNSLQDLPSGVWCDHMPALLWLEMEGNDIEQLTPSSFTRCSSLTFVNFRNNSLRSIGHDTFTPLSSVWELDISWNSLAPLPIGTFNELGHLKLLNLSYNSDMTLSLDLFFGLDNLTSLDLRGLEMPQDCQHSRVLLSLENLYFVYFDDFSSCRYALQARGCSPKSDGISSLENLLALEFLRVVVWVLAFFTVLGNSFVILGRLLIKNENNVHSLFIRNLCAADLLMGVYLLIIASRDVMYRSEFIQHALAWQESVLCQFAGFLAMLSSEVSVLLLTYMSMERCLIIVFPFRTMEPSTRQNQTCIACIWLLGLLIASLPFLIQSSTCFYGSSSVCLPLHLRSPYGQGWVYGAVVFIGLNMCAWFIILLCYGCMLVSIHRTRMRTTGQPAHKADWIGWRFFFIVLTDSLCWIPTVVLKLLVLHGVNISETFNAVIAVVVLPINSSINPILYSISTSNFKDGSLRIFRTRRQSITRLVSGNSTGHTTMSARASLDQGNSEGHVLIYERESTV
ncbi:relaxin receptor 2-like [Branchiostoma lanceolatum]|uniref:relaxin receptor 2-like n=1 Tax=Branchiostoma lanceolatum TaxID=7740 RepID=UPI0034511D30